MTQGDFHIFCLLILFLKLYSAFAFSLGHLCFLFFTSMMRCYQPPLAEGGASVNWAVPPGAEGLLIEKVGFLIGAKLQW